MIRFIMVSTLIFGMLFTPESMIKLPEAIIPKPDVIIDVGHGGIDSGTHYGDLYEKTINLEISQKTYDLLGKKGIRAVLNRAEDRALSDDNHWLRNPSRHLRDLAQRKQLANDLQARAMVSLHVNWSKNSRQSGPIVLYQPKNEASKQFAATLQSSLNALYGTSHQPIRGKTYYILKYAQCPTVIVEMGFISNDSDRARMTQADSQQKIAEAISSAIENYLKMVGQQKEPGQNGTPEPSASTG